VRAAHAVSSQAHFALYSLDFQGTGDAAITITIEGEKRGVNYEEHSSSKFPAAFTGENERIVDIPLEEKIFRDIIRFFLTAALAFRTLFL
jgi:hypothetical protein